MKKERTKARLADLVLNSGQLQWLPANPRTWRQEDINKTKKSLQTDPDFLEEHPVLLVQHGKKFVVFAGNLRTTAAKELKWGTIEAVLYTPETEEDKTTILRRSLLDNGQFGSWDYDALANEWHEFQLTDFGIPAWDEERGEQPFTPTIEDHEREGADYDSPKMVFQFTAAEFSFVSDALAQYDANKETALLMLLGYEAGTKE